MLAALIAFCLAAAGLYVAYRSGRRAGRAEGAKYVTDAMRDAMAQQREQLEQTKTLVLKTREQVLLGLADSVEGAPWK